MAAHPYSGNRHLFIGISFDALVLLMEVGVLSHYLPTDWAAASNALQWRRLVVNNIASVYGRLPIREDAFSPRILVFSVAIFLTENLN